MAPETNFSNLFSVPSTGIGSNYNSPVSNFGSEFINAPVANNSPSFNWGGFDNATTTGFNTTNGGMAGSLPTPSVGGGGWLEGMLGNSKTGAGGWAMPALGLAQAGIGGFMAYKANKTAQDTLDFQKDSFSKQFATQKKLINNQLRDRDATRKRRSSTYKSTTEFV